MNNIGKDVVLRMFYKGKEVKPGDLLIKKSIVDLECGNGFDPNNPEINFSTSTTEDNSQENQIDF